jgi:hypothetical protein
MQNNGVEHGAFYLGVGYLMESLARIWGISDDGGRFGLG